MEISLQTPSLQVDSGILPLTDLTTKRIKQSRVKVKVILMDREMPVMDDIETVKAMKEKHSDSKKINVPIHAGANSIVHLMELGAGVYLLKNTSPEDVENVLIFAAETENQFSQMVTRSMSISLLKKIISTQRI